MKGGNECEGLVGFGRASGAESNGDRPWGSGSGQRRGTVGSEVGQAERLQHGQELGLRFREFGGWV